MRPWILSFLFFFATPSFGQGPNTVLSEIFTDRPFALQGKYRFDFHPTSSVKGSADRFSISQHQAGVGVPLFDTGRDAMSFSSDYQLFRSELTAPSGLPLSFPENLHDLRFGLGYLHRFGSKQKMAMDVSVGSASDRLFKSFDDMTLSATGALSVPSGKNEWVFLVNVSNARSFLNYIPLPGVAYRFRTSRRFSALVGLPATAIFANPYPKLLLNFFAVIPVKVNASATYFLVGPVQSFVSVDWGQKRFFRAGRTDKRHLLFYDEVRVDGGLRSPIGLGFVLEIAGGYAFLRSYFEGKSYFQRASPTYDLEAGFHLHAALQYRFGKGRPKSQEASWTNPGAAGYNEHLFPGGFKR